MGRLSRLGKYELVQRIAVGGMSEIFLASQRGLDGFERAVIIKCIREDLNTDEEVKQMFLDEARIAACLKHPNVVHLYDVGRENNVAYLAMEYIFGRDLLEIGNRLNFLGRPFPLPVLMKIMSDVLAGLHYAHFVAEFEDKPLNVIHRDISPQNILVSFDGVAKLVDFGIAKASARLSQTRAGILKGKYAYMSPEQVRGKPLDHRSDQFSLAVVFYELLTGTRLFQRETDYSTMEAVDQCEVPPARVLRKDAPRRLVRILRKAMQKNPRRRFASCREMERALHTLLKGSRVEQAEQVAAFMKQLFAEELQAREKAIASADGHQRELLLASGFELLDEKVTRVGAAPEMPLAHQRYRQILEEKQGQPTQLAPLERVGADSTQKQTMPGGKRVRPWYSDWRWLVMIFMAALCLVLVVMSALEKPPAVVRPESARPLSTKPRAGVDGTLSVAVSPRVRVVVDGRELGRGAFRQHALPAGVHQVKLVDDELGQQDTFTVRIDADRDFLLAPAKYQ